jgi:predicted MFS family arabinose efflux permease
MAKILDWASNQILDCKRTLIWYLKTMVEFAESLNQRNAPDAFKSKSLRKQSEELHDATFRQVHRRWLLKNRYGIKETTSVFKVCGVSINLQILAIALSGFSAFLHLYATQSLLPLFSDLFSASEAWVSFTVSATTLAVGLTAPFIGLLADFAGRKRLIVFAVLGLCLPTLLAATAPGLLDLVAWRFVQGLFMPAVFAVTMAYISEEWVDGGVGEVMSAYVTGNILGGVCGRLLSGLIAAHCGWRCVFVILGCINLVSGLAIWSWLPSERRFRPEQISTRTLSLQLCNPALLSGYIVAFCLLFMNVSTFTYVNFLLAAPPFLLGTAELGTIFLVYLLAAVVTPVAGRWIDLTGFRTTSLAAIATASFGLLLTLNSALWLVMLGLSFCALGFFVCQTAANSYIGSVSQQNRSSSSGLYVSFYYLGGSAGAFLPGFIWPLGGWPACVALILSIQLLIATIAFFGWRQSLFEKVVETSQIDIRLPSECQVEL